MYLAFLTCMYVYFEGGSRSAGRVMCVAWSVCASHLCLSTARVALVHSGEVRPVVPRRWVGRAYAATLEIASKENKKPFFV